MNKKEHLITLFWTQFKKFVMCLNVKLVLISKTEGRKHLAHFQAEIIHKNYNNSTNINQMSPV